MGQVTVEHFPRNASVPIPIDVALFNGTTQVTGDAANLTLRVLCLENGYTWDHVDGQFRTGAAQPTTTLTPYTDYAYDYLALVQPDPTKWPRGHYRALIRDSSTSKEYDFDFSLGLMVPRSLGYSAVYDGSNLTLSVWVEENGVVQTDYTALNSCQILDKSGNVISGGSLGNNTTPNNGVFTFNAAVTLNPITNYIFSATAVCPGPATLSNYQFALRVGLARP